jgi:uncharacterized membrane protein
MNRNLKHYLVPTIIFVLLTTEMGIINKLFPYTGFKAIISLPIIYGICSIVIIIGSFLTKNLNSKSKNGIWFLVFVINTLIALQLYPQQGNQPTVLKQMGYSLFGH